jgi:hypothetical protein
VSVSRAVDVLRAGLGLQPAKKPATFEVVQVKAAPVPVDGKRPRKPAPEIQEGTGIVEGRAWGKHIVTIRHRQDKRACQHIGKRLLVIAERDVGRGKIIYLAAAYGVLESR